jgi:hypothetical protein
MGEGGIVRSFVFAFCSCVSNAPASADKLDAKDARLLGSISSNLFLKGELKADGRIDGDLWSGLQELEYYSARRNSSSGNSALILLVY